ncbi:hypothetical protein EJP82_26795 [Paenibacillus anaericanus]|uniref:Type II secretion system protein GspF domain-containing protein n=1 Tax=Paenibacillus anaericanus TaxID=170367 RepID=A0A3S1BE99_9BACL|nr:hypothetical protein [Paenibacillus anaericanus]RUT38683.1 hypothetical protein EJP82_26795 [Paenibacillus anaericanus]
MGIFVLIPIIWAVALFIVVPKSKVSIFKQQAGRVNGIPGVHNLQSEANYDGVNLNKREYLIISLGSILVGVLIAYALHNYLFLAVSMTLSYMLPRYVVSKLKRNHRQKILFELPDNLKVFSSKLNDFPSVQTALEQSVPDMHGETQKYFQEMLDDLKTGFSVESALIEIKKKIKIKRFDDFAEKLQVAVEQGFHERAIYSLKETGREMTADNLILKEMQIKSRKDMRNLFIITAMSWSMPVILSGVNTDNSNVFLDTLYGQIYIVSFVLITVYAIVKAEDYLALNLDEL